MEKTIELKVKEAKDFCKYILEPPDNSGPELTKYFEQIFDRVYLCARKLNEPGLPFMFRNEMILAAHQFAGTLRSYMENADSAWEKEIKDAINELDNSRNQAEKTYFLNGKEQFFWDLSTEFLKNIGCIRK